MENIIQPNTPLIQPAPQATSPITPLTKSTKLLSLILLGLIIVTVSVYAGIQIGKNQTSNQQPSVIQPTAEPTQVAVNPTISSTTPSSTTDPTANWKTYSMPSYSVKAPQQFQVNKRGDGVFEDLLMITVPNLSGKTPEKGIDISFSYIFGNGIVKCATNKNCFDYFNESVMGAESAGSKTITTQISATISEQTVNGFRQLDSPSDTFNLTQLRIIYPISHNGNLFQIELDAFGKSELEINQYLDSLNINQILSSFKFVN